MTDFTAVVNTSVQKIADVLKDATLTDVAKTTILSDYLLERVGALPERFDFRKPLDPEPKGAPTFARTFRHVDWVDGESRVQAGETPSEQGFNRRFNAIAADLDALGGDGKRLWEAHRALVADMLGALDDLRGQVNQLRAELRRQPGGGVRPGLGSIVHMEIAKPTKQLVEMAGKRYWLYDDAGRNVAIEAVDLKLVGGAVNLSMASDPRASGAVRAARYMEERKPLAEMIVRDKPNREALIAQFGADRLADGSTFGEVIARLPADATFETPEALVDALARGEADDLRLTPGRQDLLENAIADEGARDDAAGAPLGGTRYLSPQLSEALKEGGIGTVANLAEASAQTIREIAGRKNLSISTAEAAEIVAISKLMRHL